VIIDNVAWFDNGTSTVAPCGTSTVAPCKETIGLAGLPNFLPNLRLNRGF